MSLDDWILALHVLSAFAYVAGIVLFWVLIVAVRRAETPEDTIRMAPVVKVGNAVVGVGAGGTIVLGIWLALSYGDYDIWDGWIVAALILWFVAAATGRAHRGRVHGGDAQGPGAASLPAQTGPNAELLRLNRTSKGLLMHALSSVVVRPHPHRHDLEARRVTALASIRPDEQNLPLLLHVLGAMILVGGLLTGAAALAFARGEPKSLRLGYWSLLAVALPGWILMRIGAQWIYSEQVGTTSRRGRRACVARRSAIVVADAGGAHPARHADHRWHRRAPTERRQVVRAC